MVFLKRLCGNLNINKVFGYILDFFYLFFRIMYSNFIILIILFNGGMMSKIIKYFMLKFIVKIVINRWLLV